jgi:hypothetical protein
MSVFLKATWQNLIQLVYTAPIDEVQTLLPEGLTPEIFDGKAHIILSALEFRQTRVKGLKIPFHVHFPEINLRIPVRKQGVTGVYFLRQYVPKHCIAVVAKRIYHEAYEAYPMEFLVQHVPDADEGTSIMECHCKLWKKEDTLDIQVYAVEPENYIPVDENHPPEPAVGDADFITGFGTNDKQEIIEYRIEHRKQEFFEVREWSIRGDLTKIFDDCIPKGISEMPIHVSFSHGQAVKITQPIMSSK